MRLLCVDNEMADTHRLGKKKVDGRVSLQYHSAATHDDHEANV